jgi:hypothetical protein
MSLIGTVMLILFVCNVQAHEGFLRQFLVDDKGCVLIACWGVPSASYPDNSERALEVCFEVYVCHVQSVSLLR